MSDEQDNKAKHPKLEALSTEKLKAMLLQDFILTEDQDQEGIDISAIMEVILEREKKNPEYKPPDVEKAWADFQTFYLKKGPMEFSEEETESELPSDMPKKAESSTSNPIIELPTANQAPFPQPTRKKRLLFRPLRMFVAVAAITLMLGGVASAFGLNLFQAFVTWSAETFSFSRTADPQQGSSVMDPFGNLRASVTVITDLRLIPNWAPQGSEAIGETEVSYQSDGVRISSEYRVNGSGREFTISFWIYNAIPDEFSRVYQKDRNETSEVERNSITHYLAQNNGKSIASWTNDTVECSIQGDLTKDELERMVASIYEE